MLFHIFMKPVILFKIVVIHKDLKKACRLELLESLRDYEKVTINTKAFYWGSPSEAAEYKSSVPYIWVEYV